MAAGSEVAEKNFGATRVSGFFGECLMIAAGKGIDGELVRLVDSSRYWLCSGGAPVFGFFRGALFRCAATRNRV